MANRGASRSACKPENEVLEMRFSVILEDQGLLEQSSGAKIDYSDACATRFCEGGVWETSVLPNRACFRFGGCGAGWLNFAWS